MPRWAFAALVGAAVTAVVVAFFSSRRDEQLSRVARIEPLPVRINRGVGEPDSFEVARIRGLELYAEGDYGAARQALRDAVRLQPQHVEVTVYLGSAELLLGNLAEATPLLQQASQATDPVVREEAIWQLANAELAAGRRQQAVSALRALAAGGRRHRADAAALLERLGER
jgi:tetratricopeptide (TPR) repeat protein